MASTLNISEVDFNALKGNIKSHLASQAEFSDYNFDGSAISVLLDALAYTSHYMGVHAHMNMNEIFLETAKLRSSIVSNAKEIGYIPRSKQAATATVNLSITPVDSPASILVPYGTELSCTVNGNTYIFTVMTAASLTDQGGGVYSADVELTQGKLLTTEWTYDATNSAQKFYIRNKNIDTNSLTLKVKYNSSGGSVTSWTKYSSIVPVTKTTEAFFVQESMDGYTEIYFGDDIVGKKPIHQNVITAEYIDTDGAAANDCNTFSLSANISGYAPSEFTSTTVANAAGGADVESDKSIQITAPLNYAAQDRAVIVSDYKGLVLGQFGFIESLSIWGGEDNVPAQYGKIFMCVKPTYGNTISPGTKSNISTFIKDYNVVGISPEFVDADFTYVGVTTDVEYYKSQTTDSAAQIQTKVATAITDYFDANTVAFESDLVYSALTNDIDAASLAVKGNLTSLLLTKYYKPDVSVAESVNLVYDNTITSGSVASDEWTDSGFTYQIKDDGLGGLWEYKDSVKGSSSIGTVDYSLGTVALKSYQFPIAANSTIYMRATPVKNNITTSRNNLIRIDATPTVTVTAV